MWKERNKGKTAKLNEENRETWWKRCTTLTFLRNNLGRLATVSLSCHTVRVMSLNDVSLVLVYSDFYVIFINLLTMLCVFFNLKFHFGLQSKFTVNSEVITKCSVLPFLRLRRIGFNITFPAIFLRETFSIFRIFARKKSRTGTGLFVHGSLVLKSS